MEHMLKTSKPNDLYRIHFYLAMGEKNTPANFREFN